ncbi:MAG TPA: hypothetical protein VIC25_11415, partial [Caulobacteraceae bacterium]
MIAAAQPRCSALDIPGTWVLARRNIDLYRLIYLVFVLPSALFALRLSPIVAVTVAAAATGSAWLIWTDRRAPDGLLSRPINWRSASACIVVA